MWANYLELFHLNESKCNEQRFDLLDNNYYKLINNLCLFLKLMLFMFVAHCNMIPIT